LPLGADPRARARQQASERIIVDLARQEFDRCHPGAAFPPVVALICAFDEVDNIGDVLKAVPDEACGLPVATLVVVDGGDDGTDEVARASGAYTMVLPVNLGHGVALRTGYRLCAELGAEAVVTIDADGQNDPAELPVMLQPLVDGEADFVVASRRLGIDETSDQVRRAGVRVFAAVINAITGAHLTDTSNGYRAMRVTMLEDIVPRLVQDQYQTAEVLITALRRGWRVTERPTVWHPRASGTTKKGANWSFGFRYANVIVRTWLRER